MLLGAIYDLFFGLFILFLPVVLAKIIKLNMPAEQVYLRLDGLFLVIIGAFYYLFWMDSVRFKEVVFLAIAARISGFLFFVSAWLFFAYPVTFLLLGIGDGFWAVLHFVLYKSTLKTGSAR